MKKIFILLGIMILIVGCSPKDEVIPGDHNNVNTEVKAVYMTLDQDKAYERIQNEEVIIIDVRTIEEYGEGHLEDSNLLPVDSLESEVVTKFPDKTAVYLVYCRSGNRSKIAVNIMVELGYSEVYDIGGINTWPYEIVND